MGLFDNITRFLENDAPEILMGYIGQENLLHAERRKAATELAETNATNSAAKAKDLLKYYQGLISTKEGKATITRGFIQENLGGLMSTGMLGTFQNYIKEVEEKKQHFGSDLVKFSFLEGDSDNLLTRYTDTLNNIDKAWDSKKIEALRGNADEYKRFTNYMANTIGQYSNHFLTDIQGSNPENVSELLARSEPTLGHLFQNILQDSQFVADMKKMYGINLGDNMNKHLDELAIQTAVEKLGSNPSSTVLLKGGKNKEGGYIRHTMQLPPKSLETLNRFAAYLDKTPQQLLDEFWYITDMNEDVDFWSETNADGTPTANQIAEINRIYEPFKVAMEDLSEGMQEALKTLDPDYTGLRGQLIDDKLFDDAFALMYNKLSTRGQSIGGEEGTMPNAKAMRAAIMPFMSYNYAGEQHPWQGWRYKAVTEQEYLAARFGEFGDMNWKEYQDAYIATNKSVLNLTQLHDSVDETQLAGSAITFARRWMGFFGKGGAVEEGADAGGFISQLARAYDFDSTTHGDSVLRVVTKRIEDAGLDSEIGRAEALRIVAAFEMARSFDPSGRLSNMDIEMQLARLGGAGGYATVKDAKAGIKVAIEDLANRREYLKIFDATQYGSAKPMTAAQQAKIDATVALWQLEENYKNKSYTQGFIWVNGKLKERDAGFTGAETGGTVIRGSSPNQNQQSQNQTPPPDVEPLAISPNQEISIFPNVPIVYGQGISWVDATQRQNLKWDSGEPILMPNGDPALVGRDFDVIQNQAGQMEIIFK